MTSSLTYSDPQTNDRSVLSILFQWGSTFLKDIFSSIYDRGLHCSMTKGLLSHVQISLSLSAESSSPPLPIPAESHATAPPAPWPAPGAPPVETLRRLGRNETKSSPLRASIWRKVNPLRLSKLLEKKNTKARRKALSMLEHVECSSIVHQLLRKRRCVLWIPDEGHTARVAWPPDGKFFETPCSGPSGRDCEV